jgi:glyoxylase-like metal-dependent hydrolase (beta-lactamase superfamily II)
MTRISYVALFAALFAALAGPAPAQQQPAPAQPQPAPFATTKVEGTDNVYIFRYMNAQSMFVVTPAGVIATDPIGLARPQAVTIYLGEIRKITQAPIRYLIYSHHHFDHIAGGKPFKDAGATVVAHRRAKERLVAMNNPDVVIPDEVIEDSRTISLGGTTLELQYVGPSHSDNSIVMRLPKEKILFAVDFIPVGSVPGRGMIDFYPAQNDEALKRVLAMDWERLIPGHPGPGGRLGTKEDVRNLLAFFQDASATVKEAAMAGKCWDGVEKEVRLPKYESWPGYQQNLPFVLTRYCAYWGRGF